jgi:hypothetical protein
MGTTTAVSVAASSFIGEFVRLPVMVEELAAAVEDSCVNSSFGSKRAAAEKLNVEG